MKLIKGDCLDKMRDIPDKSIDMILCDLPYGTTQCKWDTIIPFDKLWEQYNRIIKDNGCIALFGAEPFTSTLICSNIKNFKYNWIWEKDKATGHLNAKKQPMRKTERVSIFYKKQCLYNPQLTKKLEKNIRPATTKRKNIDNYGSMDKESTRVIPIDMAYPTDILQFRGCFGDKGKSLHPTQKPVELLEYLIKTYTNESEVILDNCMGSGSTGIACLKTNRNFIGIELDDTYFDTSINRINTYIKDNNLQDVKLKIV